jgi:hypothetical protein
MPAPTLALRLTAALALQVLTALGGQATPLPRLALPLAERSGPSTALTPAFALTA